MPSVIINRQSGFSLVELSMVLVIVGVLLSGFVAGSTRFIQQNRVNKTEADLHVAKEALMGFAMTNQYLPCPDTNGDGEADASEIMGLCDNNFGLLPFLTIGIQAKDSWGRRYYYSVDENFTAAPPYYNLATTSDIKIFDKKPVPGGGGGKKIADSVAVILSLGPNQYDQNNSHLLSPDERENLSGSQNFVSKQAEPDGFDDIVTWISPGIFKSRMVAADYLP